MTKNNYKDFSLCMSVYKNDNPQDFITAYKSVTINQTYKPSEVILVIDGPVPDTLNYTINELAHLCSIPLIVIRLAENKGHAIARQTAIDAAKYDLIAIMDSDDIARPNRFEKELDYMRSHPEVDVVGGQIEEFEGTGQHVVSKRFVPLTDNEIKQFLKSRCPMSFVTIMAKKEIILRVGGIIDWFCEEDYYLWIRMVQNNCTFANLPDILVSVRVGDAMYSRRGGWKYFSSERGIQRYMLKNKIISLPRYCYNVLGRFVIQVMMPNKVRGFVFKTIFRK